MMTGATETNSFTKLGKPSKPKNKQDSSVRAAQSRSLRLSKLVKKLELSNSASTEQLGEARRAAISAKVTCRRLMNMVSKQACDQRDSLIHSVLESDPGQLFKAIKSSKCNTSSNIQTLHVGDKVYSGKDIPDGFYDSLSALKAPDMSRIFSS